VAPPAQPAAATPLAAPETVDPNWLKPRLDRERQQGRTGLLKDLGVKDEGEIKAALEAARAAEESKKTAEQRALEAAAKASTLEQAHTRASALLKEQAGRMMMVLSADQQKAVTDFAGEDPAEQLRAIHHFAPLWAKAATESAAAEAEISDAELAELEANLATVKAARGTKPAQAAAPAQTINTAPPVGAPAGTTPGSPPDHRAIYSQLVQTNPFKAAAYGLANLSAVHIPKT
jgi:hypothetical protein